MNRRDALKIMLAACAAPAIVRAESLMKIRVPKEGLIDIWDQSTENFYIGDGVETVFPYEFQCPPDREWFTLCVPQEIDQDVSQYLKKVETEIHKALAGKVFRYGC